MNKRIAIGLSGGVDSSVAAYLLKSRGCDVVAFTLKFYPQDNRCCDLESLYQAQRLCHKLDIPHYVMDVGELFKKEIIDYFIDSYLNGLTPNPCVYCNRLIKFGKFLEKVKAVGADYLATGHYACLVKERGKFLLKKNKDQKKSQEYFLSLLKPEVLEHLVFPLADYTKEDVKKIAKKHDLIFKERPESQDVCFVREDNYSDFIKENISEPKKYWGDIKNIDGEVLGKHKGFYNYTYGQRTGLGISWHEPLYVNSIDAKSREVLVGGRDHLFRDSFLVHSLNQILPFDDYRDIQVKVRYNSDSFGCTLKIKDSKAEVNLKDRIDAITPGQVASFYSGDVLLGGAIIAKDGS